MNVAVVTLLNQKGGVGKTSCTHHLSGTLALGFHKRVLIVDTDPQSSLTQGWWGPVTTRQLNPAVTIAAVLRGDHPHPEQVIHPTGLDGVDMIPGSRAATSFNTPDPHRADSEAKEVIRSFLEEVTGRYDLVLIDCPPNFNVVTQAAIIASDHLVIPAKADYLSTLGIDYLYGNVQELVEQYNSDARRFAQSRRHHKVAPEIAGIVFTMIQLMSKQPIAAHKGYMDQVKALGLPVFPTAVRENITLFASNTPRGVPVVLRDRVNSPVGDELRQLTTEFLDILRSESAAA
jgi:chromosome partitioning protein